MTFMRKNSYISDN